MKLFSKTLLCFISVIIFQSSLTIFFITNLTKRSNLEDARKELRAETAIVLENYHSWKRGLWKSLNEMQHDQPLVEILRDYRGLSFRKTIAGYLKDILHISGGDIFVLRNSAHAETDIIPMTYNYFSLADLQTLENNRPHPYLELRRIGNQLCVVGIVRLNVSVGAGGQVQAYVDLFLIRRLDREFCQQLVLNRQAQAVFFLDQQYLSGTLERSALAEMPLLTNFDATAYETHDIEISKIGYNLAAQRVETFQDGNAARKLFLIILLANTPYMTRLTVLERTVLYVTFLSAVLTILFSLFLSRNITQPIRTLFAAMQRIRSGQYDATVDFPAQNEIGELSQGFNAMAHKIRLDRAQMETYIHEITVLKDYNEKIIQSIGAGILIINRNLAVEKVNSAFLDYFKLNERQIVGKPLPDLNLELFDEPMLANIQAILAQTRETYAEIKRTPKNNRVYEINLYPIESIDETGAARRDTLGCVLVVEDVSRKIEFEEKIFQAEKLSSISMLSAGVAHEINNPLSSIMTNVQNLMAEEADAEKGIALKWIEQETRRIARIVQKLLDFASAQPDAAQGTDLNKVIEDTVTLLRYSLKRHQEITMTTDFEADLPLAAISPDEFKQTMINLLKNAMQAIREKGGITLATRHNPAEQTIAVTIADNGGGIKEEAIPRIFDPFFTTKANGEGTGLGLSVVYGIIKKYQGKITVTSQEGQGTQIRLAIPVLEK